MRSAGRTRSKDVTAAPRPGLEPGDKPAKMTQGPLTPLSVAGPQADDERQRIQRQFEEGASARETLNALCELADRNIKQILGDVLRTNKGIDSRWAPNAGVQGLCLLALGGYGRRMLFPYSDLDILFLFGNEKAEQEFRPLIAEFSRTLWDAGFRVSSAGRTLEECKRIEEDNAEFHLALLDRRFLAGDAELFERLDTKVLPGPERAARPFLLSELRKLTRERLTRYGNTIFHLEPNVKESPGGLRDYQAAAWLRQVCGEKREFWNSTAAEEELTAGAVDFLTKPFRDQALLDAIHLGLSRDGTARENRKTLAALKERFGSLSPREHEIMLQVVRGRLSKQIAGDIGIAEATVKVHRSRLMRKMKARSLPELGRMADKLKLGPDEPQPL